MWCAPSRRAGVAWSGRRLAKKARPSSTSMARVTAPSMALIEDFSASTISNSSPTGPLQINLQEIKKVKREWPDRAMVVSLMVPCEELPWKKILAAVEETGADAVELNFGCPHGMSERGMGAAVGQVPEYIEMVARWCKQHTRMPVIVKLTPNITDIRLSRACRHERGGADAVSLINTINSIIPHRSRQFRADANDRWQGQPRRLLRPRGKADCPKHDGRNRPRQGNPPACPFLASAASPTGATRRNSLPSPAARFRSAPPP